VSDRQESSASGAPAEFVIDPLPDIDLERFRGLLLRVEADVHRCGWEHNPHLRVLYDTAAADGETQQLYHRLVGCNPRCGPPTRWQGYAAQNIFGPDLFAAIDGAPWEHLHTFAMNVAYAEPGIEAADLMREFLAQPGVLGFAFVCTGWRLLHASRAEFEQFATGRLNPADHPRGKESRLLTGIDVHGRIYQVERTRGERPVLVEDTRPVGSVSNDLRLLVDGLTGQAPTEPEEFCRRYRTLRDSVAAATFVRRCIVAALPYVDTGRHELALASLASDLAKFDGDRDTLTEFDLSAVTAAFPLGRAAVVDACKRIGLGPLD
jgi:hypothetical protein